MFTSLVAYPDFTPDAVVGRAGGLSLVRSPEVVFLTSFKVHYPLTAKSARALGCRILRKEQVYRAQADGRPAVICDEEPPFATTVMISMLRLVH